MDGEPPPPYNKHFNKEEGDMKEREGNKASRLIRGELGYFN
jgi:hypothetical protein